MAPENAPIAAEDSTITGDEDLPRTVPIRVLADAAAMQPTPETTDPAIIDTQSVRIAPHVEQTANSPHKVTANLIHAYDTPMAGTLRRDVHSVESSTGIPRPRLRVLRGQKVNAEYPLADGTNFLGRGRADTSDIDLAEQEPADRIWASRRHAAIYIEADLLHIEDLHSRNGTFLNRNRLAPGQKCPLQINDVVQIGTIQMRVTV